MKRKIVSIMTAATVVLLAACGSQPSETEKAAEDAAAYEENGGQEITENNDEAGIQYTIGISQFAEHGSLDNCREGFCRDWRKPVLKKERI